MSELCLSSTTKTTTSSSLVLSDLFLYFSYFLFFSPYLLKLLSFLSPLFITTSLLLLALLSLSPSLHPNSPPSKLGLLLSTYQTLKNRVLCSKPEEEDNKNEEFHQFDELEAYKSVFDTSIFEPMEIPFQVTEGKSTDQPEMEANADTLECFLQALDEFEGIIDNVEEKKVESHGAKSEKVGGGGGQKEVSWGSEAMLINKIIISSASLNKVNTDSGDKYTSNVISADNGGEYTSDVKDIGSENLGSYGSMRREKEWKRTLACKLFEERHNVEEGGEGMDMLWETYEMDSSKAKKEKKKKGESGYYDEEEEYDDEGLDGQLCCLQALKFSARKMNLGMGRPNLVKFSKAFKGIGWLHRVTSSHGRKR